MPHISWEDGGMVYATYTYLQPILIRARSGTPVDLSPHHDQADDPEYHESNNFDFHPIDKHEKCPFGAHIRKMRPRGDLNHDHAVILRRGISYGDRVTSEEVAAKKSDDQHERGLLFVCYQSDIRNGFNFLTTRKHGFDIC